jgi:hypothetical protein
LLNQIALGTYNDMPSIFPTYILQTLSSQGFTDKMHGYATKFLEGWTPFLLLTWHSLHQLQ